MSFQLLQHNLMGKNDEFTLNDYLHRKLRAQSCLEQTRCDFFIFRIKYSFPQWNGHRLHRGDSKKTTEELHGSVLRYLHAHPKPDSRSIEVDFFSDMAIEGEGHLGHQVVVVPYPEGFGAEVRVSVLVLIEDAGQFLVENPR